MQKGKQTVHGARKPFSKDNIIREIRSLGTDGHRPASHGNRVDQEHDSRKDRKTQNPVGHDLIDLIGNRQAVSRFFLSDRPRADAADVIISGIGYDGFGIVIQLFFTVFNMLLDFGGNAVPSMSLVLGSFCAKAAGLAGIRARGSWWYNASVNATGALALAGA
jgi:hypothetical protein